MKTETPPPTPSTEGAPEAFTPFQYDGKPDDPPTHSFDGDEFAFDRDRELNHSSKETAR